MNWTPPQVKSSQVWLLNHSRTKPFPLPGVWTTCIKGQAHDGALEVSLISYRPITRNFLWSSSSNIMLDTKLSSSREAVCRMLKPQLSVYTSLLKGFPYCFIAMRTVTSQKCQVGGAIKVVSGTMKRTGTYWSCGSPSPSPSAARARCSLLSPSLKLWPAASKELWPMLLHCCIAALLRCQSRCESRGMVWSFAEPVWAGRFWLWRIEGSPHIS